MNHMLIKPQDQVYNPFLPLEEYIPDGEPHVFGDRLYLFGSHDKEGGETFCMLDYTVYSAPVSDLAHWRREGVIYHAGQDPDYESRHYMYAPDVVQGNDGDSIFTIVCPGIMDRAATGDQFRSLSAIHRPALTNIWAMFAILMEHLIMNISVLIPPC